MFVADLAVALCVAFLLSLLLIPLAVPKRASDEGPVGVVIVFFFVTLFLATWAGGLWLVPIGWPVGGTNWLPFVLVGVFVALLLAAATAPHRQRPTGSGIGGPSQRAEASASEAAMFGIITWILLVALLGAVVAAYARRPVLPVRRGVAVSVFDVSASKDIVPVTIQRIIR